MFRFLVSKGEKRSGSSEPPLEVSLSGVGEICCLFILFYLLLALSLPAIGSKLLGFNTDAAWALSDHGGVLGHNAITVV